ncbi:hypothetical protein AB5I41_24345 [Sphingomonas sp. MMS24-JH45]
MVGSQRPAIAEFRRAAASSMRRRARHSARSSPPCAHGLIAS